MDQLVRMHGERDRQLNDGSAAGIAGAVDREGSVVSLLQGVTMISCDVYKSTALMSLAQDQGKYHVYVASCLIEPYFSVDAYPNRFPDSLPVFRTSMNQPWECTKDSRRSLWHRDCVVICSGKNWAHCPPEEEYHHESHPQHHQS